MINIIRKSRMSLLLVSFLFLALFLTGCDDPVSPIESPDMPVGEEQKHSNNEDNTETTGELEVHFIDVGQGDAIFIQAPEQNVLIDGGDRGNIVVEYLQERDVSHLDLVIGTHPHADHIGGLINVMQEFSVEEVIDPAVAHTTKTFEDYLTLIDNNNITFTEGRAGMARDLGGGANLDILHPTQPSSSHLNDASVVARLSYGEVSFLFTGDVEEQAENELLSRDKQLLESDVLKVAHHGSSSSTSPAFLEATNPDFAVIMCGEDNTYGHPHSQVLELLRNHGVEVYRTDVHGSIVFVTDGETIDINSGTAGSAHTSQESGSQASSVEPEEEMATGEQAGFVGSINSDKYHHPDCQHASQVSEQNQVWFTSPDDAASHGYTPCGACRPPSS